MEISPHPNRDSDSVKNSESYDIKFLTRFPGNSALEILIKILNCVDCTKMRGRIFVKVRLIPIFNNPVILGCF